LSKARQTKEIASDLKTEIITNIIWKSKALQQNFHGLESCKTEKKQLQK
jgi:hypothetical protein